MLILVAAIAVVVRLYILRRAESERVTRHLEALESLSETSADPVASEIIERLPKSARHLLNASISIVGLLDDESKTLTLVSASGIDLPAEKSAYALDLLPIARQCLQTHEVLSANPVDAPLATRYGLGALLHIPLMVAGRSLGVMLVGDRFARGFSPADFRIARLWGRQAAVALLNTRLYDQMTQSLNARQRLLAQRDTLYSVSAAIYRPGTIQEILQRIVELAPVPLEVDAAMVDLVADDNPDELIAAAVTSPFAEKIVGNRHPVPGRKAQIVFKLRQPLAVEDGPADPTLDPQLRANLPSGSLLLLPLLRRDRSPLGILTLLRYQAGPFRTDQIDMAQLFCMRASAAIETARLYEQTRRDADTKAMLLRELNHRVKNNLAAIVTLLSLNEPDLSPDARTWLDRAVDRVRTMAQAHELFSRGRERVTLAELIDQTIRSLSVARPAGVEISQDLAAAHTSLRTDRAVSLAMVLHELCFNAIVHGIGQQGAMTIRARRDNGSVTIDVQDDGSAPHNGAPVRTGTGIGLSLVRGLVSRELRGAFTLAKSQSGGTVASLQFPLLPDELQDNPL
jgi:two-component sensor histidine kinase